MSRQVTPGRRYHRGLAFDLWNSRHAWFWHVREPRSRRGVIGAAGSEAEAADSARATIDEIQLKMTHTFVDSERVETPPGLLLPKP